MPTTCDARRLWRAKAVDQNRPMNGGDAEEAVLSLTGGEPLIFEQPLNERLRAYLRIDFLFNQSVYHAHATSQWGSRAAIATERSGTMVE